MIINTIEKFKRLWHEEQGTNGSTFVLNTREMMGVQKQVEELLESGVLKSSQVHQGSDGRHEIVTTYAQSNPIFMMLSYLLGEPNK